MSDRSLERWMHQLPCGSRARKDYEALKASIKELEAGQAVKAVNMSQCTCTTDKEMVCIVHPTGRAMKELITKLAAENAKLREALTEIADSNHLGNSWARHKAKAALEDK